MCVFATRTSSLRQLRVFQHAMKKSKEISNKTRKNKKKSKLLWCYTKNHELVWASNERRVWYSQSDPKRIAMCVYRRWENWHCVSPLSWRIRCGGGNRKYLGALGEMQPCRRQSHKAVIDGSINGRAVRFPLSVLRFSGRPGRTARGERVVRNSLAAPLNVPRFLLYLFRSKHFKSFNGFR